MSLQMVSSRSSRCCARPAKQAAIFGSRHNVSRRPVFVRAQDAPAQTGTVGPALAVEVNEENFEALVLNSEKAVLVDFWAPWCGPCRMISNVIDELAKEYKDKLVCTKLNTDQVPTIATRYNIRSIPTVIIFKGGEKMESVIGAVPKETLALTIDKYV